MKPKWQAPSKVTVGAGTPGSLKRKRQAAYDCQGQRKAEAFYAAAFERRYWAALDARQKNTVAGMAVRE